MIKFFCRSDYFKIMDDKNVFVGKHCGNQSGKEVFVSGKHVVLTFHSDSSTQERGFQMVFTFIQFSKFNGLA